MYTTVPDGTDAVVIHPDGSVRFARRAAGQQMVAMTDYLLNAAIGIRRPYDIHASSMLSYLGRRDADLPANPVATRIVRRLTFDDGDVWRGPLVVQMRLGDAGEIPPLSAAARATLHAAVVDARVEEAKRQAAPSGSSVDPAIARLDPLDLADYLARRGWQHIGLQRNTADITWWDHPEKPDAVLIFPLHTDRVGGPMLLQRALYDLAHPALALLGPATSAAAATDEVSQDELEMRADYSRYHELSRHHDSASDNQRADLVAKWFVRADELSLAWADLHAVTMARLEAPALISRLHSLLAAHPDAVTGLTLRHHEQAGALVTGSGTVAQVSDGVAAAALGSPHTVAGGVPNCGAGAAADQGPSAPLDTATETAPGL
ncbi:hypothetical protein [Nocardia asiatica]|uniref:hypothetical protein n=1 Tax=Nocardia asiatica TaxID=209252 RepID=UPI0005C25E41|nr:hypothetical protein [Nocardia asiatica]